VKLSKIILFVCTGNSCRSVMAEGIFRKMLDELGRDDVRVISAGTAAPKGMRPPPAVEKVMRREGVDVSVHRATSLTIDSIEEADLVLVMEKRHRQAVLEMNPKASGKVFLLKKFSPNPEERSLDISDPIGAPLPVYQEVLKEIKSCLQGLLGNLERYLR